MSINILYFLWKVLKFRDVVEETGCWEVFQEPISNLQLAVRQKLWELPKKALQYHQKMCLVYKVSSTILIPFSCCQFRFSLFSLFCFCAVFVFLFVFCFVFFRRWFLKPAEGSLLLALWGKDPSPSGWCSPPLGCPTRSGRSAIGLWAPLQVAA